MVQKPHRKTIRHHNFPGQFHELTFSCNARRPLLADVTVREILMEELVRARDRCDFTVLAYVVMPTHMHILVRPNQLDYCISSFLKTLKARTSKRYSVHLQETHPDLWHTLHVEEGGKRMFRLWLRGPGYDRNVYSERALRSMIRYIESNPVRKGIVGRTSDWPWSSAAEKAGKGAAVGVLGYLWDTQ